MSWDAAQYMKFGDHRTRPAADLLARVPLDRPRRLVDLGCGPGNSTALLRRRWPEAAVIGVDSADDMIRTARKSDPAVEWIQADVASWQPDQPPDLLFANAVLHWLPDHETAFPRLVGLLGTGGVLAVQMPRMEDMPTHRLMREVAAGLGWRERLAEAARLNRTQEPEAYYTHLAAQAQLDIWETRYLHALESPDAIVEWVKGTGLQPFLAPLDAAERARFLDIYRGEIARAFPPAVDGRVMLWYRRLFIVARRP